MVTQASSVICINCKISNKLSVKIGTKYKHDVVHVKVQVY